MSGFSPATVLVDFNQRDANGLTPALRRNVRGVGPLAGDWVRAMDHEGNYCDARVVVVEDRLVRLRPLKASWRDADETKLISPADHGGVAVQRATQTYAVNYLPLKSRGAQRMLEAKGG